MAVSKRTPFMGDWTQELWDREAEFILDESLVATPATLKRRRRIIEKRGGRAYPLHLMGGADRIIWLADEDEKPDKWKAFGAPGSQRPLAWIESRAWTEWHWLRGVDPDATREPIPNRVKVEVLERDWPWCQLCGGLVALGEQHLDHIQPYSLGGAHTVTNLRLTHDLCNIRRGIGN